MIRVKVHTEGLPAVILKFTDRQWAKVQAKMKRHGFKTFGQLLTAAVDDYWEKMPDEAKRAGPRATRQGPDEGR